MQAQMQKKEKSPVVFCPRCHAQNLAMQARCGKCGYVFPSKGAYKEKREAPGGAFGGAAGAGASAGVSAAAGGASRAAPRFASENEGDGAPEGGEKAADEPPKLSRPKAIPEKGVSEGLASRGQWLSCPRCGADIKPDAKRCMRCGQRP